MVENEAILYADGGSRGNPGPAAGAAVLMDTEGQILGRISQYVGENTSNVAEYIGVLAGLQMAQRKNIEALDIYLDSELLIGQITGKHVTSNQNLGNLRNRVITISSKFKKCEFHHIRREYNEQADALVNQCLDKVTDLKKFNKRVEKSTSRAKTALHKALEITKENKEAYHIIEEALEAVEAFSIMGT